MNKSMWFIGHMLEIKPSRYLSGDKEEALATIMWMAYCLGSQRMDRMLKKNQLNSRKMDVLVEKYTANLLDRDERILVNWLLFDMMYENAESLQGVRVSKTMSLRQRSKRYEKFWYGYSKSNKAMANDIKTYLSLMGNIRFKGL